jgi:hypothetical protein
VREVYPTRRQERAQRPLHRPCLRKTVSLDHHAELRSLVAPFPEDVDTRLAQLRLHLGNPQSGRPRILVQSERRQRIAEPDLSVVDPQYLLRAVACREQIESVVFVDVDDADIHQLVSRARGKVTLQRVRRRGPENRVPIHRATKDEAAGRERHCQDSYDDNQSSLHANLLRPSAAMQDILVCWESGEAAAYAPGCVENVPSTRPNVSLRRRAAHAASAYITRARAAGRYYGACAWWSKCSAQLVHAGRP